MHVIIVGDTAKPGVKEMAETVESLCVSKRMTVETFYMQPAKLEMLSTTAADLVIVLGGDGAMLGAARALAGNQVDVVGINFGKLGYMASVEQDEALSWLSSILPQTDENLFPADGSKVSIRRMIKATIVRDGANIVRGHVLNEVVLRASGPKTVDIKMEIDGNYATVYRGDGLIIATATGSTAYALAAGGSVVQPEARVFDIVPVCAFSVSSRPLIINSENQSITLTTETNECYLSFDGQENHSVRMGDKIIIEESVRTVRIRVPKTWNYYQILSSRLKWAGSY